jgi:hypothetical protein
MASMNAKELRTILERAETWPEAAQEELVQVAHEIEGELKGGEYHATREELRAIDEAVAAVDRGEIASKEEVRAAFTKFRPA